VVKHADAAELRVVAAAVLVVAANAVLVAHKLQKLVQILLPHWARLHVHNLARRNSVWHLSTENRNCRWRARVYPERENKVV
jgi:hypothetical protein